MTTNTPQQGITIEDFWALFQETERQMRETERQMKESHRETERQMKESQKETERQIKEAQRETGRQIKEVQRETEQQIKKSQRETERQIQELRDRIAEMYSNVVSPYNDLGDFAEGLLPTDVLNKFEEYNLYFDNIVHDFPIRDRGTKQVLAVVDCLLNMDMALLCKVEVNLTKGDIEEHIKCMKLISGKPNGLLGGKKLYGAVAGVKMREKTKEFAQHKGLFVLDPSGDSVHIEPPIGAPAVW